MYKGFNTHEEAVDYYWEVKQLAVNDIIRKSDCFIDEQIIYICEDIRKWAEL